ncbi:hypothetical protein, partial [Pseudomonas sp. SWRI18]|uniref:hypothetical protein n=1 Tax=Pseudomonas sp. SWRI18 TaxID=2753888 RepID=UPI001EE34D78
MNHHESSTEGRRIRHNGFLGKSKIEGATLALWAVIGGTGMLDVFSSAQNKTPSAFANGVSEFNLDDDLLSHGETP